ncbi:hypothetical protein [Pseudomonas plecoglossicida]|nr:hypothetical protein [Pseudomonas plecoglossicida]
MPTENRSSNTEMVSVTRYLAEEINAALINHGHVALPRRLQEAMNATCPQPHPEPIAWMVGTAIWWTKEEAERDAAATGLQIFGLGPMTGAAPAEQHQGKPAAWVRFRNGEPDYDGDACMIMNVPGDTLGDGDSWQPVYTHPAPADPGEVEWLRQDVADLIEARDSRVSERLSVLDGLRDQLAERDALLHEVSISPDWSLSVDLQVRISDVLSASAEPSAPAAQPGKCLDGGDCGIGGTCKWCPHTSASSAQQPS